GNPELFHLDRNTGTLRLITHAGDNVTGGGDSVEQISISADGRTVLFVYDGLGGLPGTHPAIRSDHLFTFDPATGDLTNLTLFPGISPLDRPLLFSALVSPSGAFAYARVFTQGVGVFGIAPSSSGLVEFDLAAGTQRLFASSVSPVLVSDDDTKLVCNGSSTGQPTVLLLDRPSGTTTLVSHEFGIPGQPSDGSVVRAVGASSDGRFILVDTDASNLLGTVPGQTGRHAYVFDTVAGTRWLASYASGFPDRTCNSRATPRRISEDGSTVLFTTAATDVVPGFDDTWNREELYVHDAVTRSNALVTRSLATPFQVAPGFGDVEGLSTQLSADGRRVLFTSDRPSLVAGLAPALSVSASEAIPSNTFLLDRTNGQLTHLSASSATGPGSFPGANGDASDSFVASYFLRPLLFVGGLSVVRLPGQLVAVVAMLFSFGAKRR
ncbi:MAG: hypothetical protein AAFR54_23175, partial [Planctomycetota bacterium]